MFDDLLLKIVQLLSVLWLQKDNFPIILHFLWAMCGWRSEKEGGLVTGSGLQQNKRCFHCNLLIPAANKWRLQADNDTLSSFRPECCKSLRPIALKH